MMSDDEFEGLRPRGLPRELQSWNIEDLESYIMRLKAEIERVEAQLSDKKAVGDAAASLFKS